MAVKEHIVKIDARLEAIAAQVEKATFQSSMQGADISEFFPVKRNDQIYLFMDRQHPEWTSRKQEFFNFLYTIASSNKKGFARGLIKAIFHREYIANVKWPSYG